MATPLTDATEVGTGLGMCGFDSIREALLAMPASFDRIQPDRWRQWLRSYEDTALWIDWDQAWQNGRAFLDAEDGLRGRPPRFIDWRGGSRPSPDAVIPADLRLDHVYLVSCKYLSKVLFNGAPASVFDGAMGLIPVARSADWFSEIAPLEHQALYAIVRRELTVPTSPSVASLAAADRKQVRDSLREGWPSEESASAYKDLVAAVSERSAARWRDAIGSVGRAERVLWRLLRIYDAPYFVLGTSRAGPLRLRVATPWDWSRHYRLERFEVEAKQAGQPAVTWSAMVRDRHEGRLLDVQGHVEIRWSHGRFGANPEAKVYLDTAPTEVPGYYPLV